MAKSAPLPNGITQNTKVSLRVVAALLAFVIAGLGAWYDLRGEIRDLKHSMELRMRDRWTKADDELHEMKVAVANDLIAVSHVRAAAANGTD